MMAEAAPYFFISYARVDARFVNRLQQDLELRDLHVWVDRSRLEGGQAFPQRIQQAIRGARAVLLVLTPEAMQSEWVLDEIHEAKTQGKRIIPLMLRMTDVVMEINRIQWIDFQPGYEMGLTALLRDLIAIPTLPAPPPLTVPPGADLPQELRSKLVHAVDPVPPPPPDLEQLQQAGFDALGNGDLERAVVYFEQIQEKDATFNGGFVANLLPDLQRQAKEQRIQRLRARATAAASAGNWDEAAGAWEALLGQDPDDGAARAGLPDALSRVAEAAWAAGRWDEVVGVWRGVLSMRPTPEGPVPGAAAIAAALAEAERNRTVVYVYNNVRGFVAAGNQGAARSMLTALWQQAPNYGDPQSLAAACGLPPRGSALAGQWAEERFDEFVRARQWADAALIAEMAARAAPHAAAAWQQRGTQMRLAQQLAPIQDRYDAAARSFRWAEAAAACADALHIAPNDAAWQQRQSHAQGRQAEEQRWVAAGLPPQLARAGFTLTRGKTADLILPPLCRVPAGEFLMGDDQHRVPVGEFEIAAFPVTVAEWKLALAARAVPEPSGSGDFTWQRQLQRLDHPVVYVSWLEAKKYIEWLAGQTGQTWRLLTEAEWEKAARWDSSVNPPHARVYPWGDNFDQRLANTSESGKKLTTPVGTYAVVAITDAQGRPAEISDASPYGAHDLAGNVWEWTSSIYANEPYQNDGRRENPRDETSALVLRGGSWWLDSSLARAAYRFRNGPGSHSVYVGFRLARVPVPGSR